MKQPPSLLSPLQLHLPRPAPARPPPQGAAGPALAVFTQSPRRNGRGRLLPAPRGALPAARPPPTPVPAAGPGRPALRDEAAGG